MDLSRTPNERKLYLCSWYFKAGFLCLPFLWAVNAVWFFKEAFKSPAYDEQKSIRKYVLFSAIGSIIWITLIIAWAISFQIHRADWGALGDDLSFVLRLGAP